MHKALLLCFALWVLGLSSFCSAVPPETTKVLNNFVTELARLKNVSSGQTVNFTNPREGWIHIAVKSSNAVTASFSMPEKMRREAIVFQYNEAAATSEAMKYLPAGDYRLDLALPSGAAAETLLIRAIPEIFYNGYCRESPLHECNNAARDWAFLEKYVNPNINTFVVRRSYRDGRPANKPSDKVFNEWLRRGKHWVDEAPIDRHPKDVEQTYHYYLSTLAMDDPGYSGYLVDEFVPRKGTMEKYRINIEALQRVANRPKFAGKKIYPYVVTPNAKYDDYKMVGKFAVDNRSMLAWEWYCKEEPPAKTSWDCFHLDLQADYMKQWNLFHPGAEDSLLFTFAGWNVPDCCGDVNPQLNYKVLLDWQVNLIANHPMYRKARGVNFWSSSYMDEELIRWMCRLFRHYCIEGNKGLLSTDPYVLPHLVNADCEQGTEGWDLRMAEPGTIRAGTLKDFGKIEGRYEVDNGDHFLVARRSRQRPNTIAQTIKNLTPGRLYTFRMYSADYGDLSTGDSEQQMHAVSISLPGVRILPGRELHSSYVSRGSKKIKPFDSQKSDGCWLNYYWILFRAKSETATLRVSDWVDPQRPGGEIGQELTFNFFQVEPYFAPEEMDDRRYAR